MIIMIEEGKVYVSRGGKYKRVQLLDWDVYCKLVSDANKWRRENGKDLHELNQPTLDGAVDGEDEKQD